MYDVIIIGTGPAGLSAAIYAGRAGLHTLLLEKNFVNGGQVMNTSQVDNYPGMCGISGMGLADAMKEHAQQMGIQPVKAEVKQILTDPITGWKQVVTEKECYETRSVLIAAGARHRVLGVPGEEEFAGMGVSYCATCDGAFYKDGVVAVVGGGNVAVEDALLLSRICKKVYLVHRRETLRAEKILVDALMAAENVEFCWNHTVERIEGDEEVKGLTIWNQKEESRQTLTVDGVFIAVGIIPNTDAFRGVADLDAHGYLIAGEDGATSAKGIYAAGDIRTKELRQIITAASDGANAIASIQKFLSKEK